MTQPSEKLPEFVTEAEFLERSREADLRLEYSDGIVYAMAGETKKNNRIAGNIYSRLLARADEQGCRVYMEGVQLRMPKGSKYFLPDVMLSCAPEGEDEYIEENPCVLVEVVSPTSVIRDYNEKKLEYFTLPSLQQYILVSSDKRQVEVYSRESSGWHYEVYLERGEFEVACSGQTLTLEQIYTAVKL